MNLKSRKFHVWLISLVAVLVIFLLYNLLSKTPRIKIDLTTDYPSATIADSNSEIGKIGEVGVGTIQNARYTHINEQKQVDRELGFERVLHKQEKQWDIEKPYMNIFRKKFKCYLTADKGKVQIESAIGRPSPKDATFTGNVVIRIVPEDLNSIDESFIYLDDVTFISEKTQFSTAGPVKFISENVQMLGKGAELIYNDQADLLELLRISYLESLRFKSPSTAILSPSQTQQPTEPVAIDLNQQDESIADQQTQSYKCILSENVVIKSPEHLVFTDEFTINNIFWPKSLDKKTAKADTNTPVSEEIRSTPPEEQKEPNELVEIVVTCDNGILMVPMESPRTLADFAKSTAEPNAADSKNSNSYSSVHGQKKYTLSAPKVIADLRSDGNSPIDIEHLAATGGVVQLSTVKKEGDNIIGFTKLKMHGLDYAPDQQFFLATGPGIIAVDNSRVPEANDSDARFSLNRACWAVIENFDTLKFFPASNKLIADAGPEGVLNINYFPVVDGQIQYDKQAVATASYVEALLSKTPGGEHELSSITATGGVTYEEPDRQFAGSQLFYDHTQSTIMVQGNDLQPCLLNGALVDGIEYNLKTGKLKKGKITAPGALQIK